MNHFFLLDLEITCIFCYRTSPFWLATWCMLLVPVAKVWDSRALRDTFWLWFADDFIRLDFSAQPASSVITYIDVSLNLCQAFSTLLLHNISFEGEIINISAKLLSEMLRSTASFQAAALGPDLGDCDCRSHNCGAHLTMGSLCISMKKTVQHGCGGTYR